MRKPNGWQTLDGKLANELIDLAEGFNMLIL